MAYDRYREKLIEFYDDRNRMPSYAEMMDMFGFKSRNSVYKLVNKFVDEGLVEKDGEGRLAPGDIRSSLKVLGSVQAGFPTPAEEDEMAAPMNIDDFMIDKKKASYLLTVSGDSMVDAGIHEGDMVVVEKTMNAKVGDIVIALVDGDWTMKYLRNTRGKFYLEAANPRYSDIHPSTDMQIGGVVKGVLRKY